MTSEEHKKKAEAILDGVDDAMVKLSAPSTPQAAVDGGQRALDQILALAQVHATLATVPD